MPNVTRQVLVEDFYATTITGANVPATGDFAVTLATPPANSKGWLIFSPNDSGLRERCYYHSVSGSVVSVYGINRFGPKAHLTGATVQINDVSNIFNYLSEITSSIFYVEKLGGLDVTIWGGPFLRDNLCINVGDTNLTLTNNATNYIYYKWSSNEIKKAISDALAVADDGIVVSEVVCAYSIVTSVSPRNYKVCAFTIEQGPTGAAGTNGTNGTDGATGAAGSISTAPTGAAQTINDNIVPAGSSVVTTDDSTYIEITKTDLTRTVYTLSGIYEYDSIGNLLITQLMTGVFGAQAITYADTNGSVDKTTGIYTFEGEIAYRNSSNVFTESNVFEKDVAFKGLALFPYKVWGDNVSLFDGTYGSKQKFTFTDSGSHTLKFKHIRAGGNYVFAINVTGGSAILTKATDFSDDCDTITSMYTVEATTSYPKTLAVGVHLFVAEAFSTAIHISYVGTSVAA